MRPIHRAFTFALITSLSGCALWSNRSASTPERPSDANIAAIVLAANRVDVEYATLARAKSTNPEVLAFAKRTFDDHTALTAALTKLSERIALVPQENVTSLDIRDDGDEKRQKLRELSGAAFDSAYFAIEFAYHERVWGLIETSLIPSAKHPELKALLLEALPTLGAHKGHAMSHVGPRR